MNRRDFLSGAAACGVGAAVGRPSGVWAQTDLAASRPLTMPPLLDARASGRLALTAMAGQSNFLGRRPTQTWGYNRPYLGPTLRLGPGVVGARVSNTLDEPVTVHWHGLIVAGEQDGGPHQAIASGGVWNVDLDIDQPPATLWYHSHIHERTALQVYAGLAGALQVTDGRDGDRGLPNTYGDDDLMVVLQDRRFDDDGRMVYGLSMMDVMRGFAGDTILVNGQVGATAVVPKGITRLRLLNGSNARIFSLFISDRRPMHLIATDSGLLPAPVAVEELLLAPGERAEILVDFSDGRHVAMMSRGDPNSNIGGMMGRFRGALDAGPGSAFTVLPFAVDDRSKAAIDQVPGSLDGQPVVIDGSGARLRRFSLDIGMGPGMMGGRGMMGRGMLRGGMTDAMAINGRSYDMGRIDLNADRGSVERWRISSPMLVHPFHVHGARFQVVSEDGRRPRAESSGWKDTTLVANETEILVRFDKPADRDAPFVFHCHILEHEDAGMMAQFTVR